MTVRINLEKAREIRRKYREAALVPGARHDGSLGRLRKAIAEEYGIGVRTIEDVLASRSWREKD
jgi:hypothetical protein